MPIIDKPKEWRKKVLSIFREHAKERGWAKEHATRNLAHFLFGKDDDLMIKNYVEDNKQQIEAVIYKSSSSLLGWPELFSEVEAYIEHHEREKYLIVRDGDALELLYKSLESFYGVKKRFMDDFSRRALEINFYSRYKKMPYRRKIKNPPDEYNYNFVSNRGWEDTKVEEVIFKIQNYNENSFKIYLCIKKFIDGIEKPNPNDYGFLLFTGIFGGFSNKNWGMLVNRTFEEPLFLEFYTDNKKLEILFVLVFLENSNVAKYLFKGDVFRKKLRLDVIVPEEEIPRYFLDAISGKSYV